jgi:hypothetical protein
LAGVRVASYSRMMEPLEVLKASVWDEVMSLRKAYLTRTAEAASGGSRVGVKRSVVQMEKVGSNPAVVDGSDKSPPRPFLPTDRFLDTFALTRAEFPVLSRGK